MERPNIRPRSSRPAAPASTESRTASSKAAETSSLKTQGRMGSGFIEAPLEENLAGLENCLHARPESGALEVPGRPERQPDHEPEGGPLEEMRHGQGLFAQVAELVGEEVV